MTKDGEDDLSRFDDFWDDDNDDIRPIDMQNKKNPGEGMPDPFKDAGKDEQQDDGFGKKLSATQSERSADISGRQDPAQKSGFADEGAVAGADAGTPSQGMNEKEAFSDGDKQANSSNPDADSHTESGSDSSDFETADVSQPPKMPSNMDSIVLDDEKSRKAMENSNSMVEERMLRDIDEEEARKSQVMELPERTMIEKGEYFDLLKQDPTLHDLYIGAGWDQRAFEEAPVDVDLSLFLLDKEDQTRENGDFVFYNNMEACDGAVKLMEDSRTGAGDGDDERVCVDVNGIPFDVIKIRCVISVYDDELVGHSFDKLRNVYLRLVNRVDEREIFCFELDPEDIKGGTAIEVGTLIREGPKWYFSAETKKIEGGLAAVAKSYGMLVMEDTG